MGSQEQEREHFFFLPYLLEQFIPISRISIKYLRSFTVSNSMFMWKHDAKKNSQ